MTPEALTDMNGQSVTLTRTSGSPLTGTLIVDGDNFAIKVPGGNLRPFTAADALTCEPSSS